MKIGMLISRIGGIDGVALETEKWLAVLKKLGHQVRILTGKLERQLEDTSITILPELDFHHPTTLKEQKEIFLEYDHKEEERLEKWLTTNAVLLRGKILRWFLDEKLDLLIIQNSSALPSHLRLGVALKTAIEGGWLDIPIIAHNHDFAWERGDRYETKYKFAKHIVTNYFPLISPSVKQVVINTYNQKRIEEIYNVDSTLIPNVMDFTGYTGLKGYGQTPNVALRPALGLNEKDILLFQITRIVKRKNIEAAINLVAKLKNPLVKLVITGSANDDIEGNYYQELIKLIRGQGIEDKIVFAGRHFKVAANSLRSNASPNFSLEDAYSHAAACTYFSLYEGFGNAFTEAVLAKKPIFVNNYQPVYWDDIGHYGFKTVQIEDGKLSEDAVEEIKEVLSNKQLRQDMVEYNFELGKKHFSFEVLEERLKVLIH